MANYTRLRFGNGAVSAEKLNAMIGNMDYLYENMVRGYWNVFLTPKETNLRVEGMLVSPYNYIDAVRRTALIYWPKPFSPGCSPIITNSHYMNLSYVHAVAMSAIDGTAIPNNIGFLFRAVSIFPATSEYGEQWVGDHWFPVIGLGY